MLEASANEPLDFLGDLQTTSTSALVSNLLDDELRSLFSDENTELASNGSQETWSSTVAHANGQPGTGSGVVLEEINQENYPHPILRFENDTFSAVVKEIRQEKAKERERLSSLLNAVEVSYQHLLIDFLEHRTISWDQTKNSTFSKEQLAVLEKAASLPDPLVCLAPSIPSVESHRDQLAGSWDLTRKYSQVERKSNHLENAEAGAGAGTGNISFNLHAFDPDVGLASLAPSTHRISKTPELRAMPSASSNQGSKPPLRHSNVEQLSRRLAELEAENKKLRENSTKTFAKPEVGAEYQIFHCFNNSVYLDEPTWSYQQGGSVPTLHSSQLVRNVNAYLSQYPEIAFANYREYDARIKMQNDEVVFKKPEPSKEWIAFVTSDMKDAVEGLLKIIPNSSELFPNFNVDDVMYSPYLPFYVCSEIMEDLLLDLKADHRPLIKKLNEMIQEAAGQGYKLAKQQFEKGYVSYKSIPFLIQPGQVLVSTKGRAVQAYMATTWPAKVSMESFSSTGANDSWSKLSAVFSQDQSDKIDELKAGRDGKKKKKHKMHEWYVEVWCWIYQGSLKKKEGARTFRLHISDEHEDAEFNIEELAVYPLDYASPELKALLQRRGETFCTFKDKAFVNYLEEDGIDFSTADERYMIDMATYRRLHKDRGGKTAQNITWSGLAEPQNEDISNPSPEGDAIYLFPSTIIGYNMRLKKWVDLFVDRVSKVKWNDQAFANLVIDPQSKELVQALVGSKLAAEKGTDLIAGKGNGLIILLHGGPGTGKTFTAEGVAEFAKKPLYRVTCGDIGTSPEAVEIYLQSVLYLGKIWDCVVLLDEADVFLEERGKAELQRNALVSVFLRCLEYYDGILILTSNRVGTFDEAFKSRIQLALHYERLTESQRRKIWTNFMNRVRDLDGANVDADDVLDRVNELSKHLLNGREIRNIITTARQLAQYNKQVFGYRHLQHVIEVSGRFEKYLKNLREGNSDDDIMRDAGLR